MLLKVDHVTLYSYDRPVRGVAQSHRLTPSRFDGQKAAHWSASVTGGTRGGSFRAGAGDWIEGWTVKGPAAEIEVRVAGLVETADLAGVLRGHRQQVPPECYLRESPATRMDTALSKLASAADSAPAGLSAAHALSLAVSNAAAYRPGATHAKTTAPMCCAPSPARRDCRRVMCRSICSPRRTGFRTRRHIPRPRYSCQALLPGLGWVGFDPANRCWPDERYIRLGSGLDAQEAAPIRGSARSAGEESLSVQVAVQSVQQ